MFYGNDRSALRRQYLEAWRKHREGLPLEPLEAQIADVIALHPEYHAMFADPEAATDRDWTPEQGESNPFLHMGLHLAIREQVSVDRPAGIRTVHQALRLRTGDLHEAEHRMIDCLATALWEGQRAGTPPDERLYLERLRALT